MTFSNIKTIPSFPCKMCFPGWFTGTLAHTHTSLISSPSSYTYFLSLLQGSLFSSSSCFFLCLHLQLPRVFPSHPPPTSFSKQSLSLITLPYKLSQIFFPPPSSFLPGKIPLPSFPPPLINSHSNQSDLSKYMETQKSPNIQSNLEEEKRS